MLLIFLFGQVEFEWYPIWQARINTKFWFCHNYNVIQKIKSQMPIFPIWKLITKVMRSCFSLERLINETRCNCIVLKFMLFYIIEGFFYYLIYTKIVLQLQSRSIKSDYLHILFYVFFCFCFVLFCFAHRINMYVCI